MVPFTGGSGTGVMAPEQFDRHIREDISSNATLVKAAGIKAN